MARILFFLVFTYVLWLVLNIIAVSSEQVARPITEIRVSTSGSDGPECLKNSSYPCKSINYAMTKLTKKTNIRVILESGRHTLNSTIKLQSLDGFELVGDKETVGDNGTNAARPMVICTEDNSGFYFNRSNNLNFRWFYLVNCGAVFPSTSMVNDTRENITTAFHLTECKNVSMKDIDIRDSCGVGALFYDVTGLVTFNNVVFWNNKEKNSAVHRNGSSSGGGIYIEFRPNSKENVFNSNGNYMFKNCNFVRNHAEYEHSIISESVKSDFVSFGRGGGISFIARGKSYGNTLVVDSCLFERNIALWGAGIFAEFDDESANHVINVTRTNFSHNFATMAGGGVRVGVNVFKRVSSVKLNLLHTNFTNNTAKIGGGFSQYRLSNDGREENRVLMDRCIFQNNSAYIGTSLHIQFVNIFLIHSSVLNDGRKFEHNDKLSQGALYCYSSNITLRGHNRITGNRFTAFVLDACLVFVFNSSYFTNNTGEKGGAMALYSHSIIRMTYGSKLYLQYNYASKQGGALYVETPIQTHNKHLQSTELKIYKCFLQFGDYDGSSMNADSFNAKVFFKGNSAPAQQLGMAVWITTLTWCREKNEGLYNNTVLNSWKTVDFAGDDPLKSVVSSPSFIDTNKFDWDAYPGILFQPKLVLRDENWNSVFGTVRVTIRPKRKNAVRIPNSQVTVQNKAPLMFQGDLGAEYSVTLETEERYSVSRLIPGRHLKQHCLPGFQYEQSTQRCTCLDVADGVSNCDTLKKNIVILPGRWGNPKGGKNFVKHSCPGHYCRSCNKTSLGCIYQQEKQCAEGRKQDSVLCSECEAGLSVVVGAEKCRLCDNRAEGLYVILFMLVGSVFVLAVMLINLDAYSSYLNAFFYSYQIIPLITRDIVFDPFCSFIISITNLSGFGRVQTGLCLGLQLNNMQKIALNYLVPTYIILCTVIFGALSYCIERIPFNKKACFRAFVFISVFAYNDYTKLTFHLLKPVHIEGSLYAYYAAYMKYFGTEHAPYAACALMVLVFIVLGFPLVLLLTHKITSNAKLVKLKAIFDTFQEPFEDKENFDVFPAFYFITRLALLLIDSTVEHRALHRALMCMICVVVVYIFTLFQPYKSQHMNYHDSLLLVNIAFISVINIAMGEAYVTDERAGLGICVNLLAYVPFVCLSMRGLYWAVVKIKRWRAVKRGNLNAGRPRYRSARVPSRVREHDEEPPYNLFQDNV